ncbi:MAG: 5-formyltetrahydrofolate cyclo-ligase, partial [Chlamydiae bacterium]|nr:5-formyltetrahydrofolate cyclo-ligase [Chlamydiota bacterium]
MSRKIELRSHWKEVRGSIPPDRRLDASNELFVFLREALTGKKVLSFASFGTEIDTGLVNAWLASEASLFLPRVEGPSLEIYLVKDLSLDLIASSFGPKEPDPTRCLKVDPASLDITLVPGLAFDAAHQRLGYGRGHYDRFLKNYPSFSIGVGFSEQKTAILASDPWDVPLN